MDTRLFDYIHEQFPKFNRTICDGLATEHLRVVERYIDRIWRCAEPGFPEGLRYEGYQRATPYEEFQVAPAKQKSKRIFEMARSDIYLVKYLFSYHGEMLPPRYLYLPFVRDGGIITLMGSTFSVSPVLADRAISVGVDSLFVPLNRDKLVFRRRLHHFMINGERTNSYIVWSNIYHAQRDRSKQGMNFLNMDATPVHYLLARFGFTRTFAEFANASVFVGRSNEITEEKFPSNEWYICRSCGIKPSGLKWRTYYPNDITLAVRKSEYTFTVSSMIAAFFYIVDHFPDRISPEYVDDVTMWRVTLGKVAIDQTTSEGKLLNNVEAHLTSLDGYVDYMVKDWLREDGIEVNDIYDLFIYVIDVMPEFLAQSGSEISSMYGKRLTLLRYVMMDVIKGIFNFMFAFKTGAKKEVTVTEIKNAMNRYLKPRLVIRMNRGHGEVGSISSPGDNKVFKITGCIVLQANTTQSTKHSTRNIDPSKFLHASIAEVGSFNNLPKSSPTGTSRINPYVRIDDAGGIQRDTRKVELIDRVQSQIQR